MRRYHKVIERSDRQEKRLLKANQELNTYRFHLEEKIQMELEKNRLQQDILLQQSKQAMMGEMIAHIAHQWRQPLSILNSLIIFHVMQYEKGELTAPVVAQFEEETNHVVQGMSQTINDFQNFLKPNKKREVFSLQILFDDTLVFIGEVLKQNNITIEMKQKKEVRLYSYPNELIQVFLNILNNSKDAFIDNNIENRMISVEIEDNATEVSIIFKNNAGEVESDLLEHLCKPYFTTKDEEKGTGLGLYMCEMIIENSFNGTFSLQNIKNGLATTITIPKEIQSEAY